MPVNSDRLSRPFVVGALSAFALAATSAVSPAALAEASGSDNPVTPASPLQQAEQLADSGRLIEARSILMKAARPDSSLASADRDKAVEMLDRLERRIKQTDVVEISLQKAELAVTEGDLRLAERHASAVVGRGDAKAAEKERAQGILDAIKARRATLAPEMPGLVRQAASDFESGNYIRAKAALAAVYRSGVDLSPEDRRTVDTYQVRIVQMEQAQGRLFDADVVAAGMLQPGTVRKQGEPAQPQPAQPSSTPPGDMKPVEPSKPAKPADQPPAKPSEPMQPAQPAAPAPAPSEPASGQMGGGGGPEQPLPQDQLIQMALRAEAQRILAEADAAFNEGRYPDAARKYELAITSHRQYLTGDEAKAAEARLAECRARMKMGGGLGDQAVGNLAAIREQTTAEFNNQLDQASRALAGGNVSDARDMAARARLTAERGRGAFSQGEYDAMIKKVDDFKKRIDSTDETMRQDEAKRREEEIKRKANQSEKALKEEKERRVFEGIQRARALQKEQKYSESLQVVEQVLFLDPNNPTAMFLKDLLQDLIIYRRYDEIQRAKSRGYQRMQIDAQEPLIAPRRFMDFPADWPTKTYLRSEGGAFADTPENSRTRAGLDGKKMPAHFAENTLADVIAYLEQNTGQNFDVEWESLRPLGIEPTTTVSLNLNDTPATVVLNRVLAKLGRDGQKAGWTVNDGIVTIASADSIKQHTSMHMYNVTDLLLEIPDFTDVPQVDLQAAIDGGKGKGGGNAASPFRRTSENKDNRQSRSERIRKIVDMVQRLVDPDSWRDNGGDTGTIEELNGSLIVTTTPANHREIAGLLSKLRDIRSMQINVEARFIVVNQDFFEQIGIDLDVYFNANNNQVRAAQAVDPTILPSDFFNFTSSPVLQRNLTGQFTQAGTSPPAGGDGTRIAQGATLPDPWSPIGAVGDSLGLGAFLAANNTFANDILSKAPALGVAAQFLDDIQVDFLLRATQADRRTVTLTAPRLTLTNGQTSNVYVATQRAFISDLEVVTGDSAVGFDPVPGTLIEGVILLVEAVITADRRFVTMNVDTSVNKIDRLDSQPVTAVVGGQLVNSAETQSFIQLPVTTVTRVQTTVTVPDEGTVLLGGQRLVTELEIETGVPVLSKLPIINRFFTNRIEAKTEQTLIILIKPTIMIAPEEEERNFPGLQDAVRTGMGG